MVIRLFVIVLVMIMTNGCAGSNGASASNTATNTANDNNTASRTKIISGINCKNGLNVTACQYIANTIFIPGGKYSSPYIINNSNTEYILDGDMTVDGTAIVIRASKVVLNLNGHIIKYNQTVPGDGVALDLGGTQADIAITNGSLIQGAAMSEGDQYGRYNNPIRTLEMQRLQIANIYARYGGRDVGGVWSVGAHHSVVESSTFEDVFSAGTFKDRHQGIKAVALGSGTYNVFRNNTIINCRQRGIDLNNYDQAYGNNIKINSLATNSYGFLVYGAQHIKIYDNTIIGRGEHPLGIGAVSGANDIEIYNNVIDSQVTRLGQEYSSGAPFNSGVIYAADRAVGFRTTWGGNGIKFYNNKIVVHSDSDYHGTYSPTGESVRINAGARGLMVMLLPGDISVFYNNTITALDKDGTGLAEGIAVDGYDVTRGADNSGLTFRGNTITSNIVNVAVGDQYGPSLGWPLFVQNTFEKSGNYSVYSTIGSPYYGYWTGTGKFVSNIYQGGAAQTSLSGMNFGNNNVETRPYKSLLFGRLMTVAIKDSSGNPLSNIRVTTHNQNNIDIETQKLDTTTANFQAVTDSNGIAQIIVYDYRINDSNGTLTNPTPFYYAPHTINLYNITTNQNMITTTANSSPTAWDYITSSGTYILTWAGGSITISN